MIKIETKGNFDSIEAWMKNKRMEHIRKTLEKYGKEGVDALAAATPVDTGLTASSWSYKVTVNESMIGVEWLNSNVAPGARPIPIVILIQYGHGTRNGGFVQGRDFINPVTIPLFEEITRKVWKEVSKTRE